MPVTEGKSEGKVAEAKVVPETFKAQPEPAEGSIKSADAAKAGETSVVKEASGVQISKSTTPESKKSNEEIAKEVLASRWSRGHTRQQRLKDAGYDPVEIQKEVDKIINQR